MAQLTACLTFELELLHDLVADLGHIHEALTHRHGEQFRRLERAIESWVDSDWSGEIECLKLGNGRSIMTPPASGLALVARARELGV